MGILLTREILIEKFIEPKKEELEIPERVFFRPVPVEHEPKRNHRYIVDFPENLYIEPYLVQKISRPKITFIDGKPQYSNITMELIDLIGPSTSFKIFNMIGLTEEKFESKTTNGIFTFTLFTLDPVGVPIEKWVIEIDSVVSVDFGNCNYSDDDLQRITLVLKPSDCKLEY